MDAQRLLFAFLTLAGSCAVAFIAICRLNAMGNHVLWRVRLEYATYLAMAFALAAGPWIGEWPRYTRVACAWGLVVILLCQSRAWAGDVPPDEATDFNPLHEPPKGLLTMYADLKLQLTAWYDKHFSAGWWRKTSVYGAAVGLLLPAILMIGQSAMDNWTQVAQVLNLSPWQTMCVQALFAVVIVPLLAAWKQKSVRAAVLKQAIKTGEVTSDEKTDVVQVNLKA
jgi:hypothetical protein